MHSEVGEAAFMATVHVEGVVFNRSLLNMMETANMVGVIWNVVR